MPMEKKKKKRPRCKSKRNQDRNDRFEKRENPSLLAFMWMGVAGSRYTIELCCRRQRSRRCRRNHIRRGSITQNSRMDEKKRREKKTYLIDSNKMVSSEICSHLVFGVGVINFRANLSKVLGSHTHTQDTKSAPSNRRMEMDKERRGYASCAPSE